MQASAAAGTEVAAEPTAKGPAAIESDALDVQVPEPSNELGARLGGAGNRSVAHDDLVADEADGEGGLVGQEGGRGIGEGAERPADQRVRGGVELRGAHRGGEAPDELVSEAEVADRVH